MQFDRGQRRGRVRLPAAALKRLTPLPLRHSDCGTCSDLTLLSSPHTHSRSHPLAMSPVAYVLCARQSGCRPLYAFTTVHDSLQAHCRSGVVFNLRCHRLHCTASGTAHRIRYTGLGTYQSG